MSECPNEYGWFSQRMLEEACRRLRVNGIDAEWLADRSAAADRLLDLIQPGATVGYGGSRTLEEMGVLEKLREGRCRLLDRNRPGLSAEERRELQHQAVTADYFLSGVNAVALTGQLVWIDGFGSRVGPILYGPRQVILVAGVNKICRNLEQALFRAKHVASPINAYRLQRQTPCVETGFCQNCDAADRICNYTVIMEKNPVPGRIKLLLIGEKLGF